MLRKPISRRVNRDPRSTGLTLNCDVDFPDAVERDPRSKLKTRQAVAVTEQTRMGLRGDRRAVGSRVDQVVSRPAARLVGWQLVRCVGGSEVGGSSVGGCEISGPGSVLLQT